MYFTDFCLQNEIRRRMSRILIGLMQEEMVARDATWERAQTAILDRGGHRFISGGYTFLARLETALWLRVAREINATFNYDEHFQSAQRNLDVMFQEELVAWAAQIRTLDPTFDDDWSSMAVRYSELSGRRGVQRGLRIQILLERWMDLTGQPEPDFQDLIHDPSDPNNPDTRRMNARRMAHLVLAAMGPAGIIPTVPGVRIVDDGRVRVTDAGGIRITDI